MFFCKDFKTLELVESLVYTIWSIPLEYDFGADGGPFCGGLETRKAPAFGQGFVSSLLLVYGIGHNSTDNYFLELSCLVCGGWRDFAGFRGLTCDFAGVFGY
jgi:hypothetical protein